MDYLRNLVVRDEPSTTKPTSNTTTANPLLSNLVIILLTLIFIGICLVGVLFILRRRNQSAKAQLLPSHQDHHRRLTITTSSYSGRAESIYVVEEKRNLLKHSASPPMSPVPEIRITFPDEEDRSGNRKSGRVLVVRIGDSGTVGLEPITKDKLPPYQTSDAERFHSLDLERIGGLKERSEPQRWTQLGSCH